MAENSEKLLLDYETPKASTPIVARVIAGVAGGIVVLLGVALVCGIVVDVIKAILTSRPGTDDSFFYISLIFIGIGLFAAWGGWRCFQSAIWPDRPTQSAT